MQKLEDYDQQNINDQDLQKLGQAPKYDLQVQASLRSQHVLLSVVPPLTNEATRTPSSVVCVIDVSGSMQLEANLQSEGKVETYGFNTLDLVKHSLRTIINCMTKNDKLALVSFSSKAKVELPLTKMDDVGQKKALNALKKLDPDGATNLWDGLFQGMELLRGLKGSENAAVLILTDGQPNEEPPRGHIPALQKYKQDCGGEFPGTIHTFGFGYSLDSKLLNEIAVIGKGAYAFIPDGSLVGTIFVNSISNLLSTAAVNVSLEVDLKDLKVNNDEILKYQDKTTTEQKIEIKLGSVQFGQNKSVILPVSFLDNDNKVLSGTIKYKSPFQAPVTAPFQLKIDNLDDPQAEIAHYRIASANALLSAVESLLINPGDLKSQSALIAQLLHQITTSTVKDDKFIKDLVIDLKEQVTIALSTPELYNKWGKHYLPSLASAHLNQQCNNFKDPGVQHFGGQVFQKNRDALDTIFLALPAPEPSIKSAANIQVNNMANYYNAGGGCIAGDCMVLMGDGTLKQLKLLRQGDVLRSSEGKTAKVQCLVITATINHKSFMVSLEGGLKITPWHPVRLNGCFEFPINLGPVTKVACEEVYNLVMEDNHIVTVNGVECVTLGHGFKENSVVRHGYFGTAAVIEDLSQATGWKEGRVELMSEWVHRDEETGLIGKITQV